MKQALTIIGVIMVAALGGFLAQWIHAPSQPASTDTVVKGQAVGLSSRPDSIRPGQVVLDISCPGFRVGTPACTPEGEYLWLQSLPIATPAMLAYAEFSASGVTIHQTVATRREDIFTLSLFAFAGPFESREKAQSWLDAASPFFGERDFYSFLITPLLPILAILMQSDG